MNRRSSLIAAGFAIVLAATATTAGVIDLHAETAFFSSTQASKGILIAAGKDNVALCIGHGTFPIMDATLADDTTTKFWIYQYTGKETHDKTTFRGKYFLSPAQIAAGSTIPAGGTELKKMELGHIYYIQSDHDLHFRCGDGLSVNPFPGENGGPSSESSIASSEAASQVSEHAKPVSSSSASAIACQTQNDCPFECRNDTNGDACFPRYVCEQGICVDMEQSSQASAASNSEESSSSLHKAPSALSITQLSPSSGPAGTKVIVDGTGFAPTGNIVHFAGTEIDNLDSPDGTTLLFTVPGTMPCQATPPNPCDPAPYAAGNYDVTVQNGNATSNALTFTITASSSSASSASSQPSAALSITSLTPSSGPTGTQVTIEGTGFDPAKNAVHFADSTLTNIPSSDGMHLAFTVPGATDLPCMHAKPACFPVSHSYVPGDYSVSVSVGTQKSNALTFTVTGIGSGGSSSSGNVSMCTSGQTSVVSFGNGLPEQFGRSTLAVGDFDKDGKMDVVAEQNGSVTVYHNDGNGAFSQALSQSLGNGAGGNAIFSDVNGDGYPDIISASQNFASDMGTIGYVVLLNNQNGGFQYPIDIELPTGTMFTSMSFAMDHGDIITDTGRAPIEHNLSRIHVGQWSSVIARNVTVSPYSIGTQQPPANGLGSIWTLADLNGNGQMQLVQLSPTYDNDIDLIVGNDNLGPVLGGPSSYSGLGKEAWISVGDINGDGKPDIAVLAYNPSPKYPDAYGLEGSVTYWMENMGGGNWRYHVIDQGSVGSANLDTAIAIGDLNGDGKADLVTDTKLYEQNASSCVPFPSATDFDMNGGQSPSSSSAVSTGNSDSSASSVVINANSSSSSVQTQMSSAPAQITACMENLPQAVGSPDPQQVALGDLNGDGKPDIAVTYWDNQQNDSRVAILLNQGNDQFALDKTYALTYPGAVIAIGDVNGDGKGDIVVGGSSDNKGTAQTVNALMTLMNNGDGTFGPAVDTTINGSPEFLSTGDFNGDGNSDIAVRAWPYNDYLKFEIYNSNGDGTFSLGRVLSADSQAGFFVSGDFNGDGKADLAYDHSTPNDMYGEPQPNSIHVLLNQGNETFADSTLQQVGSLQGAGDFNGDGKTDLILNNDLYLNNGDATFSLDNQLPQYQRPGDLSAGQTDQVTAVGDVNDDATQDILLLNGGINNADAWVSGLDVLTGDGKGNVAQTNHCAMRITWPVSSASAQSSAASYDSSVSTAKGHLDMQLADARYPNDNEIDDTFTVTNTGTGTAHFVTLGSSGPVATADPVTHYAFKSAYLLSSNGSFLTNVSCTEQGSDVSCESIGDLAPGQKITVVWTYWFPDDNYALHYPGTAALCPSTNQDIQVYASNIDNPQEQSLLSRDILCPASASSEAASSEQSSTDTVNSSSSTSSVEESSKSPVIYCLNDSDCPVPECVFGGACGPILHCVNDVCVPLQTQSSSNAVSSAQSSAQVAMCTGDYYQTYGIDGEIDGATSIAEADLNGDGKTDLVATLNPGSANAYAGIFLNAGNGLFAHDISSPVDIGAGAVVTGDLNGDGKIDYVFAGKGTGKISVYLNSGTGGFVSHANYSGPYTPGGYSFPSISLADVNGDGYLDIVAANDASGAANPPNSNSVMIFMNNKNGTFANPVSYATSGVPFAVATADLNGDGLPDIAVTDAVGYDLNHVSVLINNGGGTFKPAVDYPVGHTPKSISIADVDGDKYPDLIVGNFDDDSVSVLINDENGNFKSKTDYATTDFPNAVAVGDLNGDKFPDIVVSEENNGIGVLMNNGNGTFGTRTDYHVAGLPDDVVIADVNGDKAPDIAASKQEGDISVLLNDGKGNFGPQTACDTVGQMSDADLAVSLAATPAQVSVDGTVTFTVNLHNNGPADAHNVYVSNIANPQIKYIHGSTLTGTFDLPTGYWSVGSLQNGQTATLTITATVTTSGEFLDFADVSGVDSNTANNTARAAVTAWAANSASSSSSSVSSVLAQCVSDSACAIPPSKCPLILGKNACPVRYCFNGSCQQATGKTSNAQFTVQGNGTLQGMPEGYSGTVGSAQITAAGSTAQLQNVAFFIDAQGMYIDASKLLVCGTNNFQTETEAGTPYNSGAITGEVMVIAQCPKNLNLGAAVNVSMYASMVDLYMGSKQGTLKAYFDAQDTTWSDASGTHTGLGTPETLIDAGSYSMSRAYTMNVQKTGHNGIPVVADVTSSAGNSSLFAGILDLLASIFMIPLQAASSLDASLLHF